MIYFYIVMVAVCGIKIILTMSGTIPLKNHSAAALTSLLDAILIVYFAVMAINLL